MRIIAVIITSWLLAVLPASAQEFDTTARAAWVYDMSTGTVLMEKNADEALPPASMSKLMTLYMMFEALQQGRLSLDERFAVSTRARKMAGSTMFLDTTDRVSVEDLLRGVIVMSGNDACVVVAEGMAGTEEAFARQMTERGQRLGLTRSHFTNASGWPDPGHRMSARDLGVLAQHLIADFPEYYGDFAQREFAYDNRAPSNRFNRNPLLAMGIGADGLKTGHTDAAGYCLVATARREFPNVGERRMLTVVLGASSDNVRTTESQKLLNWGYTAFDDVKLFDADEAVATPRVWKGNAKTLELGSATPIVVAVPSGSADKVKTEVARPEPLIAPFTEGETVATLKVSLGDQQLNEVPLVSLKTVSEAGIFRRAWDAAWLWVTGWF